MEPLPQTKGLNDGDREEETEHGNTDQNLWRVLYTLVEMTEPTVLLFSVEPGINYAIYCPILADPKHVVSSQARVHEMRR